MVVLLDASPLGLVTNPNESAETLQCSRWLESLLSNGIRVLVPEISDYEVRRELLRADKFRGLQRLDALKTRIGYLPITTQVMLVAANFWAQARKRGRPTAGEDDIDCDMILAAQAAGLSARGEHAVIATANVRHLSLFADARHWRDISPER
jgi:predicted nucleic acid-binding protein